MVIPGQAADRDHIAVATPTVLIPLAPVGSVFLGHHPQRVERYVAVRRIGNMEFEPDVTVDEQLRAILDGEVGGGQAADAAGRGWRRDGRRRRGRRRHSGGHNRRGCRWDGRRWDGRRWDGRRWDGRRRRFRGHGRRQGGRRGGGGRVGGGCCRLLGARRGRVGGHNGRRLGRLGGRLGDVRSRDGRRRLVGCAVAGGQQPGQQKRGQRRAAGLFHGCSFRPQGSFETFEVWRE